MKLLQRMTWLAAVGIALALPAPAQDKPREDVVKASTLREPLGLPLRLQVVFSEYDGEKKVSSLPYTLTSIASDQTMNRRVARLRMGLRVPIPTKDGGVTYMDVGTDIDAEVLPISDGRFRVDLNVRRSLVYGQTGVPGGAPGGKDLTGGADSGRPILGNFSSESQFYLRDGQTAQSTVSTDPHSGRVTKIEVTLSVVK